jgi:DNA-binding NarL/FixJ family response regulator
MTAAFLDRRISVGIVDDNQFVSGTLRFLLNLSPNLKVVAEAENGSEAITMVEVFRPDVVLMDIRLPDMNGIDATRIITSRFPNTKVIVFNMQTNRSYSACAYAVGASYFLSKGCNNEEILDVIMECTPGNKETAGLIKPDILE